MAPASSQPFFAKDEKVLCFHHELLYEAKVLDARPEDPSDKKSAMQFKVHYKGWKNTWDDWVPQDRIRKFTEENIELSKSLKREMDALRAQNEKPKKPAGSVRKKGGAGSEFSSQRGSEERTIPAKGVKRGRDYDIEKTEFRSSKEDITERALLWYIMAKTKAGSRPSTRSSTRRSSMPTETVMANGNNNSDFMSNGNPAAESLENGTALATAQEPSNSPPSSLSSELSSAQSLSPPPAFQPGDLNAKADSVASTPKSEDKAGTPPRKGARLKFTTTPLSPRNRVYKAKRTSPSLKIKKASAGRERFLGDGFNVAKRLFYKGVGEENRMMLAGVPAERKATGEESFKSQPARQKTQISNIKQEETFMNRPEIPIHVPDHLKGILVDDWENVTKNLQLVHLPSKTPVNQIMTDYFEDEKANRRPGSAEAELLEEVVQGVKQYFDASMGRILLYRFERDQYADVRKLWAAGEGEWAGKKSVGDVYGAEHLIRLFVKMPALVAQTNMDIQSSHKLVNEIGKVTQWLARNSRKYFSEPYETASQEYIERARGLGN